MAVSDNRPRGVFECFAVGSDPVADYVRLAAIPSDNVAEVEEFLRAQESESNALAVLERPSEPVALLRIRGGEATLFSLSTTQSGRTAMREIYIGKIYDAVITQIHAVEDLAEPSAPKPERVEIAGSRLGGVINLTGYTPEERAALMVALHGLVGGT